MDASIYRLVPRAVVGPGSPGAGPLAYARARRHLTFRAGGTSLSGQAVTDDILVELAPFGRACVLDGGARLVPTEFVGGRVNRLLAPLGRRGWDPPPSTRP